MRIVSIELVNFRNYDNLLWHPSHQANVIVGKNGVGKSNLAEAIYLAATTKSHRTSRDSETIQLGKPFCRIACEVSREKDNDILIEIIIEKNQKTVKLNKTKQQKISEAVGQLKTVIFSASDVDMVKGEPSGRRRFLNLEICQIRPRYCLALAKFKRILEQRNSLLKDCLEGKCDAAELSIWDSQLALNGSVLIAQREEFCREINVLAGQLYSELCGSGESLSIRYEPNIKISNGDTEEEIRTKFYEQLSSLRTAEIARGVTLRGPQRDDIAITVDGLDLRYYGSRGQQRGAALAIKIAEAELIYKRTGEYPVVILDDVASELDPERRSRALGLLNGKCQSFLTTTSVDDLPQLEKMECRIFQVKDRNIEEILEHSTL